MMPQSPEHETVQLTPTEHITAEELIKRARQVPAVREAIAIEAARQTTSYRGEAPASTGAQPVPQHDPSFWGQVPKWALGTFLAAPAVGGGIALSGFGLKLVFDSITTEGVVMVGVIAAGAVTFVCSLCSLVKRAGDAAAKAPTPTTNNFSGDVKITKNTLVQPEARSFSFQRNHISDGGV